jgi:hypothetical protein
MGLIMSTQPLNGAEGFYDVEREFGLRYSFSSEGKSLHIFYYISDNGAVYVWLAEETILYRLLP